jgi:hypothetical protein
MTTYAEITLVLFAVAAIMWPTYTLSNYLGSKRACESVKMEWVKDKCMKVTREEVK